MAFNFDLDYKFPNTINEIDAFSGQEFERFLFEFFRLEGYKPIKTGDSGDRGIDILIEKQEEDKILKIGIQAKRWKSSVGYDAITLMLGGKNHYKLDTVWIITTSNLTKQAEDEALNNDIKIINRDYVIEMLHALKTNPKAKFKESIKISQSQPISQKITSNPPKEEIEITLEQKIKQLRNKLANDNKIYPSYIIFGNDTVEEIVKYLPLNIIELNTIKGLGEKRINNYGKDIIDTVIEYLNSKYQKEIQDLKLLREKIVAYNKIENNDKAFNDLSILEIIIKKPKNINELNTLKFFPKENINIFGEYLIKQIS